MKYIKILGNKNLYDDVMETLNNLEENEGFNFGGAIEDEFLTVENGEWKIKGE